MREGSEYGDLIRTCIKEGTIVPMEVTVKLLENAMHAALKESREGEGWADGHGRFLIDGFPRKMDQAAKFDDEVKTTYHSSYPLFYAKTIGLPVFSRSLLLYNRGSHAGTPP